MKAKIIIKRTIGILLSVFFLPVLFGIIAKFGTTIDSFCIGFTAGLCMDVLLLGLYAFIELLILLFE